MDAVIERYKPTLRVSRTAFAPWLSSPGGTAHSPAPSVNLVRPEQLVEAGQRVVVVAPHPDDEVLALGATLAALSRAGREILLVAVTDGDADTAATSPAHHPEEIDLALRRLGIQPHVLRLHLPEGAVALHERRLAESLPLGSLDTVFVPWRHDGHPDHEACARATLSACRTVGARCLEFPVWALVPSRPAHARLRQRRLQRVEVSAELTAAKRLAVATYTHPSLPEDARDAWLQDRSEWLLG